MRNNSAPTHNRDGSPIDRTPTTVLADRIVKAKEANSKGYRCEKCNEWIGTSERAYRIGDNYYHTHHIPESLKSQIECRFCHLAFKPLEKIVFNSPYYYHPACRPPRFINDGGVDMTVYGNLFQKRRHCHFMMAQQPESKKWKENLKEIQEEIKKYLQQHPEVAEVLGRQLADG